MMNSRQRGVTLVELMVAMLLSVMLGAVVVTTFTNNSRSFKQDENILRMQDDARHALHEIAFEITMAGHYADLLVPGSIVLDGGLTLGSDCGPAASPNWMYDARQVGTGLNLSVLAVDNATAGLASASHSCIGGGELEEGTDVVSVKRVAGARTAATTAGGVYLRTNGTVGLLYKAPMPGAPTITVPVPNDDWEYRPSVFYVRNYANAPGDGIPTLCKKVLRGAAPSMTTECIATGIEDLQIEYGIDVSGDGNPNLYLANPTLVQLQNATSARIFLLARTANTDLNYDNDKTYVVSNAVPYTPNDNYHRKIYSTTVTIQNVRSLQAMGF